MSSTKTATLLSATVLLLQACTNTTPYLSSRFGYAVNAAKSQQTINPAASNNTDPVAGIGGVEAKEAVGRYYDSFKAPPPTFEIFVGGTAGER